MWRVRNFIYKSTKNNQFSPVNYGSLKTHDWDIVNLNYFYRLYLICRKILECLQGGVTLLLKCNCVVIVCWAGDGVMAVMWCSRSSPEICDTSRDHNLVIRSKLRMSPETSTLQMNISWNVSSHDRWLCQSIPDHLTVRLFSVTVSPCLSSPWASRCSSSASMSSPPSSPSSATASSSTWWWW